MTQIKPDLFILYPIFLSDAREPFFDGEFFLAEKHLMEIVDTFSFKLKGKIQTLDQTKCLKVVPVKVRPEEVFFGNYNLWGVKQRVN